MKKNSALSALLLGCSISLAFAGPGVDEVGDPDSFGNNVIYLGIAQTPGVSLLDDCTPDPMYPPDPESRCITLKPQPLTTTFDEGKLDYIKLPGGSTKRMMWCTTSAAPARASARSIHLSSSKTLATRICW